MSSSDWKYTVITNDVHGNAHSEDIFLGPEATISAVLADVVDFHVMGDTTIVIKVDENPG